MAVGGRITGQGPGVRRSIGRDVPRAERLVSLLGGVGLAAFGLQRRGVAGMLLVAVGGSLIVRGASGRRAVSRYAGLGESDLAGPPATVLDLSRATQVDLALTVCRPAAEVYAFMRQVGHLPTFLRHVDSVTEVSDQHSRWVGQGAFGANVTWDTEIMVDEPDCRIGWRATADGDLITTGELVLTPAPADRGTVLRVHLDYLPPGGRLAQGVARLFGEAPEQRVREDLRHAKQVMEAGEVPTTVGQTSCR